VAGACGLDPVEIRLRNAMRTGDRLITGQVVESVAPVERCIRETAALPLPDEPIGGVDGDPMRLPGGAGRTADALARAPRGRLGRGDQEPHVLRGVRRLLDGALPARRRTGHAQVRHRRGGPGVRHDRRQIARTILGVDDVDLDTIDTQIGSAGSTSASRQTWMSGGAVDAACRKVRERLFEHVAALHGLDPLRLGHRRHRRDRHDGRSACARGRGVTAGVVFDETVEYHHRVTEDLDENGQGNCHVAFAFVAHRAVVDVDPDLGLVKVVQIATAQDVGRALNPLSVIGQIEGGIAQGLGLAVMEEIIQIDGRIRNASFTDYLLPTMLDMPPVWPRCRGARPAGAARRQGRGRTPVHLVDAGHRGRHPRRAAPGRRCRQAARPGPGAPRRHRTVTLQQRQG
jgi:CO/xanthine dehydrogenase Mo-binding subunit